MDNTRKAVEMAASIVGFYSLNEYYQSSILESLNQGMIEEREFVISNSDKMLDVIRHSFAPVSAKDDAIAKIEAYITAFTK